MKEVRPDGCSSSPTGVSVRMFFDGGNNLSLVLSVSIRIAGTLSAERNGGCDRLNDSTVIVVKGVNCFRIERYHSN